MPKLENIHIWISPLTKKVYIGTLEVNNDLLVAKSKVDRTNEFIDTMVGGEVEITEHDSKKYCIKLEED